MRDSLADTRGSVPRALRGERRVRCGSSWHIIVLIDTLTARHAAGPTDLDRHVHNFHDPQEDIQANPPLFSENSPKTHRVRITMRACACMPVRARVHVTMHARVRECARARGCVNVRGCVRGRARAQVRVRVRACVRELRACMRCRACRVWSVKSSGSSLCPTQDFRMFAEPDMISAIIWYPYLHYPYPYSHYPCPS